MFYSSFVFDGSIQYKRLICIYNLVCTLRVGAFNSETDVVIFVGVDEAEVLFIFCRRSHNCFLDAWIEIQDIQVIKEFTIEAAKHNQAVAHQNAGVTTSRLWNRMSNLELVPLLLFDVEALDVIDVYIVSATKNV